MTTQHALSKLLAKPWLPHAYMKKAVRFLISQAVAGLFLDPGLGKTSITLAAIKLLKKQRLISKILIIAPLRPCYTTWPNEIAKWKDFNGLTYTILHGPHKDKRLQEDVDIYLMNPEGIDWLLKPEKVKRGKKTSVHVDVRAFKKLGFDALVIDELTKFKNHGSLRFKTIKQVLPTFARRWGLTGSPAANGLLQLFGQLYMLDEGRSLGRFISHYRDKYFNVDFNGFSYTLKDDAEQAIYEAIAPVVLRMAAEDYLELPQLIENIVTLELPPSARKIYDGMEKSLFAELDRGEVTAKNAGVALGKCRQIVSGAIYQEAGLGELVKVRKARREWTAIHDEKLNALEDMIEELNGKPCMVVYEFNHDLVRIQERLAPAGQSLPVIGSGTGMKEYKEIEAAWNRGEIPVLLVHPVSAAHGLNMQESGQHIIWFTLTWDYELYDQLIRRLLRQGSKHLRIFVHMLIVANSVDEAVLGSIRGKRTGQNNLFTALKELQSHRKRR